MFASRLAVAQQTEPVSTWTPLRIGVFRAMWIAVLVSNIGTWMQAVGAQWLVVHLPHAAILVSLVQAADYLPDVLFAIVGGVLADIFDRRLILIVVQLALAVVGLALTVLTYLGEMPPALLLTFTFVIGTSSVFTNPAFQSLVPDLVPREQLRAASNLSGISINVARLVGPALAGVLIARLGVAAVFGANAATYLFFGIVVLLWRPERSSRPQLPERFLSAIRAGSRYVRNAPVVRRVLVRSAVFLVPGSVLWALLPLVATQRLHLGATGYGILLGALGAGAIVGALVLPRLQRARLSSNAMLTVSSCAYAAVTVIVALVPSYPLAIGVLIVAGVAWIVVFATLNAELQLFLPAWVRARGLSVYQMVLFGAQAVGAVLGGLIAEPFGIEFALVIAACAMIAGAATIWWWPLIETAGWDRSTVAWPEPHLVFDAAPAEGPVVVRTMYTVSQERERDFLEAMELVRQSRLRTGATQWGLFRDGDQLHRFVELFVVPSWEEHLRQHRYRQTGTDRDFEERAIALSDTPPETAHWIAVE